MTKQDPLFTTPGWVGADRPRSVRDWSGNSKVYVTTWGDHVHLFADCPGTKGFGADPTVKQVKLSARACTARRGCQRCFGDFWSGTSIEELNRLIEVLHGRIDEGPHRRTRSIIAEKIARRYGEATGGSRSSNARRVVTSRSDPKKPPRVPAKMDATLIPPPSKADAKRRRDQAAAASLGVTVEELRALRRSEQEANRERKTR